MPADLYQRFTGERTQSVRKQQSLISLETSNSSILADVNTRPPETAPFYLDNGEKVHLRIFIDKSIVEVFVNGKQCVAARVYPGRDDSMGVSLKSLGNDAELTQLKAWSMKSIY